MSPWKVLRGWKIRAWAQQWAVTRLKDSMAPRGQQGRPPTQSRLKTPQEGTSAVPTPQAAVGMRKESRPFQELEF